MGFSRFASVGNQADVDLAELVTSFAAHEATELIAIYAEDFSDGRAFVDAAAAASTPVVLLTVGRRIKGSKRRFELYSWDGQREGLLRNFRQVRFARRMRVEGVAHGTVAGRGAVVFMDDRGGYQLLWDDDPRLAVTEELTW